MSLASTLVVSLTLGASVATVFTLGVLYGVYNAPKPCVPNLAEPTHLSILNLQPLLDDVRTFPADSAYAKMGIKDSREFAYYLVDIFNQDNARQEQIYTNPITKEEYWIPSRCYAVIDGVGDPILYRK
jgi:disulfide oxidoreductase YuzD